LGGARIVIRRTLREFISGPKNERGEIDELNKGIVSTDIYDVQCNNERPISNIIGGYVPICRSKPNVFETKLWAVSGEEFVPSKLKLAFAGETEPDSCCAQNNGGDSKNAGEPSKISSVTRESFVCFFLFLHGMATGAVILCCLGIYLYRRVEAL